TDRAGCECEIGRYFCLSITHIGFVRICLDKCERLEKKNNKELSKIIYFQNRRILILKMALHG
ncbi:MAG: hypothetical protein ACE5WD_13290, partial [Candidatus Aminicenantia bacterium]